MPSTEPTNTKQSTFNIITERETYSVDAGGNIGRPAIGMAPSGQWKILGIVTYNNFGHRTGYVPFPFNHVDMSKIEWRYRNGKPRWRVVDLDHGALREQMSPGLVRIERT
jgi:hypothetical protein